MGEGRLTLKIFSRCTRTRDRTLRHHKRSTNLEFRRVSFVLGRLQGTTLQKRSAGEPSRMLDTLSASNIYNIYILFIYIYVVPLYKITNNIASRDDQQAAVILGEGEKK